MLKGPDVILDRNHCPSSLGCEGDKRWWESLWPGRGQWWRHLAQRAATATGVETDAGRREGAKVNKFECIIVD